jgi:hypothetical protein
MASVTEETEAVVIRHLKPGQTMMLDEFIEHIPELTWNQVFQSVDALCRRGVISLRRRGFNYEVSTLPQHVIR